MMTSYKLILYIYAVQKCSTYTVVVLYCMREILLIDA